MKKCVLFLFVFMILFTFCSCSNKEQNKTNNGQQPSQNSIDTSYYLTKQYIETEYNGIYAKYEMNVDAQGNILSGNVKGEGLMEGNNLSVTLSHDEFGRIKNATLCDITNSGEQNVSTINFTYKMVNKSEFSEKENDLYDANVEKYIDIPNVFYVSVPTFSIENPHEDFIQIIYDENNRVIAKNDFAEESTYYYSYFSNGSVKSKVKYIKQHEDVQVWKYDEHGNVIANTKFFNGQETYKFEYNCIYEKDELVKIEECFDGEKYIYLFKDGILNGYKTIVENKTNEFICEQIKENDESIKCVVKTADGVVLFEEKYDKFYRYIINETPLSVENQGTLKSTLLYYKGTNKMAKHETILYNESGDEISKSASAWEYAKK